MQDTHPRMYESSLKYNVLLWEPGVRYIPIVYVCMCVSVHLLLDFLLYVIAIASQFMVRLKVSMKKRKMMNITNEHTQRITSSIRLTLTIKRKIDVRLGFNLSIFFSFYPFEPLLSFHLSTFHSSLLWYISIDYSFVLILPICLCVIVSFISMLWLHIKCLSTISNKKKDTMDKPT